MIGICKLDKVLFKFGQNLLKSYLNKVVQI
jgi:hypothetical protein